MSDAEMAVYRWWQDNYGYREAARFRTWMAFVRSGKTAKFVAHRLGQREQTIWRWLLDPAYHFDLKQMFFIGTALNMRVQVEMRPLEAA